MHGFGALVSPREAGFARDPDLLLAVPALIVVDDPSADRARGVDVERRRGRSCAFVGIRCVTRPTRYAVIFSSDSSWTVKQTVGGTAAAANGGTDGNGGNRASTCPVTWE